MTASTQERSTPAWSDADLADPHAATDKAARVRSMFGAICRRYDLNNRVHSLWLDQGWRRAAVRAADVKPGDAALDVACGTGDLTQALARTAASRVVGVDFTPAMLDLARRKRSQLPAPVASRIEYVEGDAQALPFPDATFDAATIAFGLRNVAEPARAIAELARVLRPGGRVVILEFERPRLAPVRAFHAWYGGRLMPRTAAWLAGDRTGAYRYLPRSVETFMPRGELCASLERAGFRAVEARPLTLGICAWVRGVRA